MHLLWSIFLPAGTYQLLSIAAELRHLLRRTHAPPSGSAIPVSVLKPLRGLDPNSYPAFVSQIHQNYPEFEIIFGATDADDPALEQVRKLKQEFPSAPISIVTGGPKTPNGKVGLLQELSVHARFPLRVVNDSDIKVTPDYLARVTSPLSHPDVGVVTCPYRVNAHNLPAAWEAIGITTSFIPSALVAATIVGVREFGFGSTLAFRALDLEAVGGFAAIADFIADDYQLAKRITASGKRAVLSNYTVETSLGDATWPGVWRHQLRWARTIRVSNGGYAGLPVTHAGLWALLAWAIGAWPVLIALLGLRVFSAFLSSALVLRSWQSALLCWLSPVWDLYSFAIWAASYAGNTVRWRDRLLEIDSQGRIKPVT